MIDARIARILTALAVPIALLVALACTREVEVPVEVVKTVEVVKEVPVTKEVIKEVPVEVEKIVERIVTPTPAPATPPPPPTAKVYRTGMFDEPSTRNYWNFYGGPGGSVWSAYVLDGVATTLYTFSEQRFDWIPDLADGFPTPLKQETINDQELWTSEIKLKKGARWSDGVEITAHDFVFVVDTVMGLQLGGNFEGNVNTEFVDHVEALDSHTVKVYFNQMPGLSVWQYGLAFTPILPRHYWAPIVASAKQAGTDIESMKAALFS
ncbi:MAG: ABC transporter substrate-binding protein, partial [Chloroflexi bacterium]|nr:ABC transporter substrate-binding protein [Chloroflexota bacterium]